jgi:hypothetical protein
LAIVIDSGANINKTVNEFCSELIYKIPCSGHRLNLCVDDLFKEKQINEHEDKQVRTVLTTKKFDSHGKLKTAIINKEA